MNLSELEKPFEEPWQAEAFAMAVKLHEGGAFTWNEWASALSSALKAVPERPYYESWLCALEAITIEKSLVNETERVARVAAWDRAAKATPHGKPILLENA